ncbi:MAG: MbnP family protein [Bacteroidota bacterium]
MKLFLSALIVLTVNAFWSQTEVRVRVMFEGQEVKLNKLYIDSNGDSTQFDVVKFYITKLKINDKTPLSNADYLVDVENAESLILLKSTESIDQISFLLGVDSTTNVAGILEGPLDPINGMYWAWNSGYINFKMSGISTAIASSKQSFEYHLGGYLPPYPTIQQFKFEGIPSAAIVHIDIALDKCLNSFLSSQVSNLMIPGKMATKLANQLQNVVTISYEF